MSVGIYKKAARDVMTRDLVTVRTSESVHDALLLMAENRVAALPVVNPRGTIVGIISQSDIVALARDVEVENEARLPEYGPLLLADDRLDSITTERVDDVMSEKIVHAEPDELVTSVADKMLRHEIHHVPVCNEERELVGLISTIDILAALREPVLR